MSKKVSSYLAILIIISVLLTACASTKVSQGTFLYNTPEEAVNGQVAASDEQLTVDLLASGAVIREDESISVRPLTGEAYTGEAFEAIREVHLISRTEPGSVPQVRYIKLEPKKGSSQYATDQAESLPDDTSAETGEPSFLSKIKALLSGVGENSVFSLPIPILSLILCVVAYYIVFQPLRKFIINREAPNTMDIKVPKLPTADGFEVDEFDLQIAYIPSTQPDQYDRFKGMGLARVEEQIRQEVAAWAAGVVVNASLFDVQRAIIEACRAVVRGQDNLPGSTFNFSSVGIVPLRLQSGGIKFSASQEAIRTAKAGARAKGEFFKSIAEAAGPAAQQALLAEVLSGTHVFIPMHLPQDVMVEE